jgi:hypothetical protein
MKTCYYCDRGIIHGKKIIDNGIHYVCQNNDTQICNNIIKHKEETKKQDYIQLQTNIKQNEAAEIKCDCGNSFYTDFPIETFPPCDDCPYCGVTHYSKK